MAEAIERMSPNPKVVLFDLDGTLTLGGMPLQESMVSKIGELMTKKVVGFVSGSEFERIERLVLKPLSPWITPNNCHVFANGGADEYVYDGQNWVCTTENILPESDKIVIEETMRECMKEVLNPEVFKGYRIVTEEKSKVVFASLPAGFTHEEAVKWAGDGSALRNFKRAVESRLPQGKFEVHIGGEVTFDVTLKGVHKGNAVSMLAKRININPREMLFVGDGFLKDGEGNDRPVLASQIPALRTDGPNRTMKIIDRILKVRN